MYLHISIHTCFLLSNTFIYRQKIQLYIYICIFIFVNLNIYIYTHRITRSLCDIRMCCDCFQTEHLQTKTLKCQRVSNIQAQFFRFFSFHPVLVLIGRVSTTVPDGRAGSCTKDDVRLSGESTSIYSYIYIYI